MELKYLALLEHISKNDDVRTSQLHFKFKLHYKTIKKRINVCVDKGWVSCSDDDGVTVYNITKKGMKVIEALS